MTTPAIFPAAMILLLALAAAHDRRHAAMAAWYGMAVAFSPIVLLAAPLFAAITVARRLPIATAAAFALPALGTAMALHALGLPRTEVATLPPWQGAAALAVAVLAVGCGTLAIRRRHRFA